MSRPISIVSLLTIIKGNADAALNSHAHAEIMAANMDLNAGKAAEAHREAVQALLNNTAALHNALAPKDPTANGRISLAG